MSDDMTFVQKSDKDVWQTPPRITDLLDRHFAVDIDPCAGEGTDIGRVNFRPPENDALTDPWTVEGSDPVTAFVNPPFSAKQEFLARGVEQFALGNVDRVVFLTPDSTDVQSWWHGYIAEYCRYTWFPYGRVEYIDPDPDSDGNSGASFGSALSVLGELPDGFREHAIENGDLVCREHVPTDPL